MVLVLPEHAQQSLLRRARLRGGLQTNALNALNVLLVKSPTNVADQPRWLGEHQQSLKSSQLN